MCYIELCNSKKIGHQVRLGARSDKTTTKFGSRFHRRQWECDKNSQIFKFKRIHIVYDIIDFFQKLILNAMGYVD